MKTHSRIGGIIFISLTSMALRCGGGGDNTFNPTGPTSGTIHHCLVVNNPDWPQAQNVVVDKPAECPIMLSTPGTSLDYSATGKFIPNSTDRDATLEIYDAGGSVPVTQGWSSYWTEPAMYCPSTEDRCRYDIVYIDGR